MSKGENDGCRFPLLSWHSYEQCPFYSQRCPSLEDELYDRHLASPGIQQLGGIFVCLGGWTLGISVVALGPLPLFP